MQMRNWPELLDALGESSVFHSDLMLTEGVYDSDTLRQVSRKLSLYAVNVKGLTPEEWLTNTRKPLDEKLFWLNWRELQSQCVPSYITFTACDKRKLGDFWKRAEQNGIEISLWDKDWFTIDLVSYKAVSHVDDIPYGGQR